MIAENDAVRFTRHDLTKWDVPPKAQTRRYHGGRTPEPRTDTLARHTGTDVRITPVVPQDIRRAVEKIAADQRWSINLTIMKLLVRGILAVQDGESL
jgi:hypothetical protein